MADEPAPTTTDAMRDLPALLEVAGVPPRFADRRFATFTPRAGTVQALEAAQRVAAGDGGGLILLGRPGAGKTHLAVAILAHRAERLLLTYPEPLRFNLATRLELMRPRFPSRFVSVPAMLDELRHNVGEGGPDPLAPLLTAPVLVLDDVGRERSTDWATDRLYVLVDHRYGARLPTVATSNFGLDELANRGYDAMVSRLIEDGVAVQLTAGDYRRELYRGEVGR
jgi:DNA replication protein DnaC